VLIITNRICLSHKCGQIIFVVLHGISEMLMMNRRSYYLHRTYLVWGDL